METNPIYDFLKTNNLTSKDESSFLSEYSSPEKAKELHGFFVNNNLTTKGFDDFYGEYFKVKKKDFQGFSQELPKPTMPSGEKFTQGIGLGVKPISSTVSPSASKPPKSTTPSVSTGEKTNLDYLRDINSLYKEKINTSQQRINAKRELLALQPEIEDAYSKIEDLSSIYNDQNLSPQERNDAAKAYNDLVTEFQPMKSKYDNLVLSYNDLVKKDKQEVIKLKEIDNQRQLQLKKEFSLSKDLLEKTGKGFVDAAAGISGIFNTLGLSGDPESPEIQEEVKEQTRQNIEKIRSFGNSLVTQETPKEWQSIFEGKFSPKKLAYVTSQAVSSTIPTVAAGLFTGGAGTALAGAGMGFNESKDILKEAGLNDSQAEWASLGLSIPLGLLEEYGAGDIVKILSSPVIKKKVANELVKNLAGKKITKELLFVESKKSLGKVIKENAGGIFNTGLKESGTEVGQGTLQEIAKQTAQEYTGVDPDQEIPFSEYAKSFAMQRAEEGIGGFLGGTTLATAGKGAELGLSRFQTNFTPTVYSQAVEFKDPEKLQEFQEDLEGDIAEGLITPEQAQEALQNVQAIVEADNLIPNNIIDNDIRTNAVNLIIEKNNIERDIESKDKSLVTPLTERVKEIDDQLVAISKGEKIEEKALEEVTDVDSKIGEPIKTDESGISQKDIIAGDTGVEVTEPVIQEGEGQDKEQTPAVKEQETIAEASDSKGVYLKDGEYGVLRTEGQTVVFETNDKIFDLGNKDELSDVSIAEFGIEKEEPLNIQINQDNSIVIDDVRFVNNFSEPQAAINTDADGNVISVNLETEDGKKRTFRGQRAEEIAYQYKLKEFEQNATEESIARLEQEVTSIEGKAEKAKSETKKRSAAKRKSETIKTKEDAVQEQTAGQVPVQPKAKDSSGDIGSRADDSRAEKSDISADSNKKQPSKKVDSTEEAVSEEIGSGLLNFLGIPLEASTEGEVKFSKTTGEPQVLISTEEKEKQIVDQMNKMNLVNEGIDLVAPSTTEEKIDVDELNSRLDNPLKTIEWADYEGMPFTFTISDQLRTSDAVNPNTGETITNLKGGIGFNGTKGNENNAWANTTKDEAETMLQRAKDVYANNKPLFDKLWKEGKLPDGHIPMAVVKMAETSILSNEAVFRVGIQNIETLPKTNRKKAVSELAKSMQAKINTESASLKRGVDKNGKPYTENTIKLKKKGINQYQKILDSINNNKYDDIVDILKDKDNFSLPEKSLIANEVFYGSPTPIGGKGIDILRSRPSTPVSKALIGNKNPSLINLGKITDLLTEPSMKNVPNMHVVSVVGVDVKATEVNKINHPNYPYGVKGVSIGVLKNPVHMKDAFGEAYGSALGQVVKNEAANASVSVKSALTQGIPVQSGLPNRVFKSAIARGELDAVDKLAGFLRQAFPSTTFFTSNEAWDAAMADPSIKKKLKDGDVVYAFTTDGNVFINPSLKTTKATLHETGHIWMGFIKENNPNLYAKGLSLVDGTKEYAKAKEQYGDTELAREEALMELMSSKGDTIVNAAQKAKFKEWLLSAYKYIANNFNSLLGLSPKEIENLTLDKFLEGMLADVLSGKELTTKKIKGKVKFSLESQNEKIKEYIDAQRKAGQTDKNIRTGIEMVADRLGLSALDIDNLMNAEKIENSKKAFEFWLNLGSNNNKFIVSAKMKSEAAKAGIDEKALKNAAKTMKNIDEIRKKLLGAEVIKTIDCKWG